MNMLTAGADTPAADGVEPDATVVTPEPTTGQQADADTGDTSAPADTGADPGDDAAAPPRKKPGIHNRIDELTRQKHDALRDRDYWQNKAKELEAKISPDMSYDDELIVKMRREGATERAEAAEATVAFAVEQQWQLLREEARSKWADYEQVEHRVGATIPPEMVELIKESEVGADVAYHLGKNPREVTRLAQMSGKQLAKEIGRLEARLTAPRAAANVPPAPVRPVNGIAAGGSADPGTMSMSEYAAWRKANP